MVNNKGKKMSKKPKALLSDEQKLHLWREDERTIADNILRIAEDKNDLRPHLEKPRGEAGFIRALAKRAAQKMAEGGLINITPAELERLENNDPDKFKALLNTIISTTTMRRLLSLSSRYPKRRRQKIPSPPTLDTLIPIALALEVRLSDLLGRRNDAAEIGYRNTRELLGAMMGDKKEAERLAKLLFSARKLHSS